MKRSKIFQNILLTSPAIVSGILLIFSSVVATAQETQSIAVSSDANTSASVTPVELLPLGSTAQVLENNSVATASLSIEPKKHVEQPPQQSLVDINSTDLPIKTAQKSSEAQIEETGIPTGERITPYSEIE
ncbi:MAG TPA: hypothetical protein V6D26_30260, partial [Stenomitos sp.]